MKKIILLIAFFWVFQLAAQTSIYNKLLQKHVSNSGVVDYKSFKKDQEKLATYISYLQETTPQESWSNNKQKAFWINAYNAYTLQLILENYPLNSIMDIKKNGKTAWKIPFAKVGGETYTLDYIEHEILRKKLFDPRIHVGVNCASISCPKLANIAFTENNIDATLEDLMKAFVNDNTRNKIAKNTIEISSLFDWFTEDFTINSSLIAYLNMYSETKINSDATISYLKYDWSLNNK
jgi:hypothetical protein